MPASSSGSSHHAHHSGTTTGGLGGNMGGSIDDLARVFNTAVIASRVEAKKDHSFALYEMIETPAFRAILTAVRQHARLQGISDRQAAEQIILTFRKMDQIWDDYIYREGIDRIRGGGKPTP